MWKYFKQIQTNIQSIWFKYRHIRVMKRKPSQWNRDQGISMNFLKKIQYYNELDLGNYKKAGNKFNDLKKVRTHQTIYNDL